jgi:hypothetical protein
MSAAWILWASVALAATMLLALTAALILRRREHSRSRPVYLRHR